MARYGKYNVTMNKGVTFWSVILTLIKFLIAMYAGGLVVIAVVEAVNLSGNPFEAGFNLLGITQASAGATASISSTGLIGVASVLAAVFVIMKFVKVRKV